MVMTDYGMVTLDNDLQSKKAHLPIEVTVSGITTFFNQMHLSRA